VRTPTAGIFQRFQCFMYSWILALVESELPLLKSCRCWLLNDMQGLISVVSIRQSLSYLSNQDGRKEHISLINYVLFVMNLHSSSLKYI